jgi:hypothetical protein
MGIFDAWFNFDDLEAKTNNLLTKKYAMARETALGPLQGAEKSGMANMQIQGQRQGILGSPLMTTLENRLKTETANKKAQIEAGLGAQQASEAANMGLQMGMAKNQATGQLFNSAFEGLGKLVGWALPTPIKPV